MNKKKDDIILTRKINAAVDISNLVDRVEVTIKELEIENEEGCSDFVDMYPDEEIAKVMLAIADELKERYSK